MDKIKIFFRFPFLISLSSVNDLTWSPLQPGLLFRSHAKADLVRVLFPHSIYLYPSGETSLARKILLNMTITCKIQKEYKEEEAITHWSTIQKKPLHLKTIRSPFGLRSLFMADNASSVIRIFKFLNFKEWLIGGHFIHCNRAAKTFLRKKGLFASFQWNQ